MLMKKIIFSDDYDLIFWKISVSSKYDNKFYFFIAIPLFVIENIKKFVRSLIRFTQITIKSILLNDIVF